MNEELAPKRGRGRPKGTGGNKRPDRTEAMSLHTDPGDNRKYLQHSMAMFNWPKVDFKEPQQVLERVTAYFQLCADDDMKPSVAGLALAFGIDRRRLWEIANEVKGHALITHDVNPQTVDYIKKAYQILNAQMEDYAQNGKINPVAAIFLMKNHFGYLDKQEVVLTPNNPLGDVIPEEELKKKYLEDTICDYDTED